jgi:hypothetical protein
MEEFFRVLLQAPLLNARWSWGAIRELDGVVFLRVWQDEKIRRDGTWYLKLTARDFYRTKPNSLGWIERQKQVAAIQNGAPAYLVMCEAVDALTEPRVIKDFDRRSVFRGGDVMESAGELWISMLARVNIHDLKI